MGITVSRTDVWIVLVPILPAKKPSEEAFLRRLFFGTSAGVAKVGEVSLTEFVSIDGIVFSPICGAVMINEGESFFVSAGSVRLFRWPF